MGALPKIKRYGKEEKQHVKTLTTQKISILATVQPTIAFELRKCHGWRLLGT